ncbi:hypothetical protein QTP88_005820 [Uroleucon formosanum]
MKRDRFRNTETPLGTGQVHFKKKKKILKAELVYKQYNHYSKTKTSYLYVIVYRLHLEIKIFYYKGIISHLCIITYDSGLNLNTKQIFVLKCAFFWNFICTIVQATTATGSGINDFVPDKSPPFVHGRGRSVL